MNTTGIRFISSNSSSGGSVGVGLSTIRGPTGPAGAFGGPQGLQGPIGSGGGGTGPQGFQGSVGLQGLRGSTGSDGVTGSRGYQGSKGDVGQGFVVFSTTSSYTGLNSIIATGGNVGEFVLITGGELFVYMGTGAGSTGPGVSYQYAGDVTDESKLVGVQGPQGLRGSTGSNGVQGLVGPTGSNGSVGLQGLVGPTGSNGSVGLQGLVGPTGSNGSVGLQGLVGPTGSNGSVGLQGLVGPTGSVGLQGPSASGTGAGTQGFQGIIGPQGIPGAAVGSLANVKLSFTRTNDSPSVSGAGIRIYAFSGATGVFNTPSSNISFTPSNGRFTVSEQGDYYFDSRIIIKGSNNPDFITTDVYVNSNTGPIYTYTHVAYGIVSPVAFPIAFYTPLNSGDYIHLSCYATGTAGPINFKAGTTMNLFRLTNGPSGPQGSIGPQGPTGSNGLPGTQGLIGPTGSSGINGVQGMQGPTGSDGLPGVQGLQGPTGSSGINGVQGLVGPQGIVGMGFTVFANTNSYTGLSDLSPTGGNIGQFVLVLGGQLYVYAGTGSGYTGPDNSYGYAGDVTDESKLIGTQGPIGFQGSIGLQGSTGSTGSIGPQGLQGPQGLVGSTGAVGSAGYNAVATYNYKYSTTTTFGNPGQGLFRLNNSVMGSSTGMYINSTDGAGLGNDLGKVFGALNTYGSPGNRGFIKIQKSSDYTWYFVYEIKNVTQQATGATGWYSFELNCTLPDNNFTNNDDVYLSIIPAGPPGVTGTQGNQGFIGLQGPTGPAADITGQSTQLIFNQSGAYTGSNNLTYDYSRNLLTVPNVVASSGSFTNLLLSSGNIMLGGGAGSTNQRPNSIAIGNSAGNINQGTGSGNGYSVAIGYVSGQSNQGYGSISVGNSSGRYNQGELSVSVGTSSGYQNQGTRSIGIGQGAGYQYQGDYSISLGDSSGQDYQGTESVSIGRSAGLSYQNPYSVAIGPYAGQLYQSTGNVNGGSIAIGSRAGQTLQQYQSVAIGYYAGQNNQGANSIAIGANAGYNNQASNSIVINASGNQLNGTGTGFFVNPIRSNTGSSLLMYNTANSEISYSNRISQNIIISASNNATGSSTGALVVTGGVNVNGESVFNNIVYAPSLNPNFISRGNPGQSSPLLLSNYNTVHYYSTTSATGFIDISTTMVENAVYEVEFNCIGASASNDDMFFYPNYNTSFGGTTFYNVYTQSSGSPGIQYTSANSSAFYFDYVSGSIGWEPVGKIRIYNNRSAKKVKVEVGDTTAIVNGQGYWTSGSGFTNNSVSNISYDTSTQWSNIGRLTMSSGYGITFTNWNVWVKRIM